MRNIWDIVLAKGTIFATGLDRIEKSRKSIQTAVFTVVRETYET